MGSPHGILKSPTSMQSLSQSSRVASKDKQSALNWNYRSPTSQTSSSDNLHRSARYAGWRDLAGVRRSPTHTNSPDYYKMQTRIHPDDDHRSPHDRSPGYNNWHWHDSPSHNARRETEFEGPPTMSRSRSVNVVSLQDVGKPNFASHGAQPLDSMASLATTAGGGPWSLRSPGRIQRTFTLGGQTIHEAEDAGQEHRAPPPRSDPKSWDTRAMRKWEKRLHGEELTPAESARRLQQQELDASLGEHFSINRRARSCEGVSSHPAQRNMRAAFTDRSMMRAHDRDNVFLWSPKEEHSRPNQAEEDAGNAFAMLPAGSTSHQTCCYKDRHFHLHNEPAAAVAKRGEGWKQPLKSNSDGARKAMAVWSSPEPWHERPEVREENEVLRKQFGRKGNGQTSPMVDSRMRARSAEGCAGNTRRREHFTDLMHNDNQQDEVGHIRRQVLTGRNSARQVSESLSAREAPAAGRPGSDRFQCFTGCTPGGATIRSTYMEDRPRPEFGLSSDRGRPDFWFSSNCLVDAPRRGQRSSRDRDVSEEARKHTINRDFESISMFKAELDALGEGRRLRRSNSQPPGYASYNPVTHEGEIVAGSLEQNELSRGDRKASGRGNRSGDAGLALNHHAVRQDQERHRNTRLAHEPHFADLCHATARTKQEQQDKVSQMILQNHHQKSSNMAMLLTWE